MRCMAKYFGLLAAFAATGLSATTATAAETLVVARQSIADEKAVFATVESTSVVPARGRIGGTVAQLKVREGDRVTAGQAIAAIGDEKLVLQMKSLDAQIEALQAQANQAQLDFTRTEGLVERGILPRIKLDEQRTALNVAENGLRAKTAERAVINEQLNQGQVLAPADGRVLKRLITVGSVVLAGDPIVTVAQQNFKLRLRVPERHARFLKAGDKVRVDGAELAGEASKWGVVDLVYPQIEEGRVIADATVEGLGEYFVGDRLRVWVAAGTRTAFVIPAGYVTTRFGIDYVRIRKGDEAIDVPVQRGRHLPTPSLPDGLEILSGIQAGDQLVRP
ncbi:efflux RND transporter periplasmic adaptor subunit [Bradyrhizobium sp. WBOS7]|uniref:Efflux RND transporter periplasmic adaptor subunit n=2 Tax=Nitrobacteraceae TaxID=41294 RepID=A0AAE9NGC1_9BRAD|nr:MULTISPECIES: efflux RND transporter periplasmic adaptor subunit [Bradyrhizobium]MDD1569143.1 efflux RND transporter periplasmic adaptor subunit [Bradyrhizobium sp. WBOS1]UUO37950.1 efflux RND transporter periplasmic adaptor subunit [Bradyrhizobium sp. WBOS01]MDD1527082.1 efflux RND transporter periplasmic adaptor subunit [Bradyrhizobium sp. WBOS2]MDD1576262.1 efflux RND transporter periplasmic adaptor subunit [Bradyrhizobium sp. WBOS7]MDD1602516.1 efflux RND transporter periplasmic adaptor